MMYGDGANIGAVCEISQNRRAAGIYVAVSADLTPQPPLPQGEGEPEHASAEATLFADALPYQGRASAKAGRGLFATDGFKTPYPGSHCVWSQNCRKPPVETTRTSGSAPSTRKATARASGILLAGAKRARATAAASGVTPG